jgi:selenide,water dikinase
VPRLPSVDHYLAEGCIPGGTLRNYDSYGHKIGTPERRQKHLLCDPQTSGGLLVAVSPREAEFLRGGRTGPALAPIGELVERQSHAVEVI